MEISINQAQKVYVLKGKAGFSCFGFENALLEAQALADKLGQPELRPEDKEMGTLSVMEKRNKLLSLLRAGNRDIGTWYDPRTPKKVQIILETARKKVDELRFFFGDADSGRDWLEENDVMGSIGRSTGPMKVPLLIEEGECGGPSILDHCIVRVIRVRDGKELYRHPGYHQPKFSVSTGDDPAYPVVVEADGGVHARFKGDAYAFGWLAFMMGTSFTRVSI